MKFCVILSVGPRDQVVLPLRGQIVGAIDSDDRLYLRANASIGVIAIGVGIVWRVTGERHERTEVSASGIAHQSDACRIDLQFGAMATNPLDGRTGVMHRCRITIFSHRGLGDSRC